MGHEIAGRIVEMGKVAQQQSPLKPGDLVSVEPHHYCGMCKPCRTGLPYLCVKKEAYGVTAPGGLAEYIVVDYRNLYHVPRGVSSVKAALAENVACGIHGIDRAAIPLGADVVILGAGAVGQILIQLARRAGSGRIMAIDPVAERCRRAVVLGACQAARPEQGAEMVWDITGGNGADVVIEASGNPEAQALAFKLAGRAATIEFFGVAPNTATVPINGFDVYQKEWRLVGAAFNWAAHSRAIELAESLELEQIVDRRLSLGEIAEVLVTGNRQGATKLGYVAHD